MTRKDYALIARHLRYRMPNQTDEKTLNGWWDAVSAVSLAMSKENPRFDREKFEKACSGQ